MRKRNPDMDGAFLNAPAFENEPSVEKMLEYSLTGSAQEVAEKIVNESLDYGTTHISTFFQFANMFHQQTLASLELFRADAIPAVKKELR